MFKKKLPEDVVVDILSRLPANSLVRFKSVHKSWYALIESPHFVTMQLRNNNSIHFLVGNRVLIDTDDSDTIRILWSLLTFDDKMWEISNGEDVSFSMKSLDLPFSCPYNGWSDFSNICDGIICFYDYQDRDGIMIMANPGIGEFRFLPVSCFPLPNSDEYDHYLCPRKTHVVGLGFDCRTNDCKVIRILEMESPYLSPGEVQAEVYSSSTNIWREIEYTDYYMIPEENRRMSTYWNGAYYWPATKRQGGSRGILSFDFSDEVFEFRTIPEHLPWFYDLIEFNETLAFISYPHPEQEMEKRFDIWVMGEYGANEVWTKLFSTKPVLEVDRALGFGMSTELFVLLSSGLIASYNIVTNEMKTLLPIDGEGFVNNHSIVLYKGSLVSINREIFHGR
ncbi:hypothetical protein SLEP1_g10384 [Rubroshorea leprosula]|uniref:F-box domain-containing protein n=1 Tax=Rubroshorea leprosula TaxID=152421 RepID=A0AAV5IHT7_9ROSI|nr:hypothetical protein SLEP1_g10384 [Rubroshorea leprosula]